MAVKKINSRIKNKRDLECNWEQARNFIPLPGEIIIYSRELDANDQICTKADGSLALPSDRLYTQAHYKYDRIKIGDGYTTVGALPFVNQPKVFNGTMTQNNPSWKYLQRETIFREWVTLSAPNYSTSLEINDFELMPVGNKIQQIYTFMTNASTEEEKQAILNEATFSFNVSVSNYYMDGTRLLVKPNLWLSGWTFDLTPNNKSTTFNASSDMYTASANFKIHAPSNITCTNTGSSSDHIAYVVRITFEKIDESKVLVDPEFFITGVKN